MELDAFLADSVMKSDGKLFALGAGWDRLSARRFPARHSRLSLGAIVKVPYRGVDTDHELVVRFEDADGNALPFGGRSDRSDAGPMQLTARFTTRRPTEDEAGDERSVVLALNLDGLVFEAPGRYRFLLDIDDTPVKHLAFRVVQAGD